MFGLFRKKKAVAPADPLATFDQVIESVERQGAALRRSAATLLALRGQLARDQERYEARGRDLDGRVLKAADAGDAKAERTLRVDCLEARRLLEQTEAALARVQVDGALLVQAAEALGRQLAELKEERQSARARLSADALVTAALQQQVEHFDRVLRLDEARDEVERAHALAELYREERKERG